VPAAAGPVDRRQDRQEGRIVKGVRSGEITRSEAARLQREESRLAFEEARYRLSGQGLSQRERADLQRDLNRISRNIYRQGHDRQSR
jgi:hypothetical protein